MTNRNYVFLSLDSFECYAELASPLRIYTETSNMF